jgi:hypothetical protein
LDCQLLILAGTVATKNTKCISKSLPNSLPVRLAGGGWFVLREKYYWLVAYKPSEQGD